MSKKTNEQTVFFFFIFFIFDEIILVYEDFFWSKNARIVKPRMNLIIRVLFDADLDAKLQKKNFRFDEKFEDIFFSGSKTFDNKGIII